MTNEIVPPISRTVTRTLGVQILLQQSTDRVSLLLSNSSKLLENDVFTEGALRPLYSAGCPTSGTLSATRPIPCCHPPQRPRAPHPPTATPNGIPNGMQIQIFSLT